MKTLATPCKIVLECYLRQGNSRTANHRREHVRFRPSKKLVTAGFLSMITAKYKCINPIASSSSSTPSLPSEPQVNLETSETEEQGTCQMKKRVHVKFQIQKECSFGEQFMIVGNDPMLGLWSPAGAIPLQWSDGHVWTVELDVPVEETIQYKFILKGINGTISWQPGPDRILKTWDTEKMIFVWEDWGNADVQKKMEEEPSAHDDAGSEITSEMLIIADILTHRDEDVDSEVGNGSVTGLSPVSESFNIEKSIALDGSLGVNEVMGHHLPKEAITSSGHVTSE